MAPIGQGVKGPPGDPMYPGDAVHDVNPTLLAGLRPKRRRWMPLLRALDKPERLDPRAPATGPRTQLQRRLRGCTAKALRAVP